MESRLMRDIPASREMNFTAQISKYGGLWHDNKCASCREPDCWPRPYSV